MRFQLILIFRKFNSRRRSKLLQRYFQEIMKAKKFGNSESLSGEGSTLKSTETIRQSLQNFVFERSILSITDVPCGDAHWMAAENFFGVHYQGFDIVEELIARNNQKYLSSTVEFQCKDIVEQPLNQNSDLLICRDLLVHLSLSDCVRALKNICMGNSRYIALTTFTNTLSNNELEYPDFESSVVGWRPLNLSLPPFNFGEPVQLINENCQERGSDRIYNDKCLAIYELAKIRSYLGM